jgi:hypothetical protein
MKTSKNKQTEKFAIFGFIANFCAVFALIYVVALLLAANMIGGSAAGLAAVSAPLKETCSCQTATDACSASFPTVLFPESAQNPVETDTQLIVDDSGFLPKELDLSLSSLRVVEVSNKGVNRHSFVIDELGVDTGPIEPGSSKTVRLDNLGAAKDSYIFYSNTGKDNKNNFRGTLIAKAQQ